MTRKNLLIIVAAGLFIALRYPARGPVLATTPATSAPTAVAGVAATSPARPPAPPAPGDARFRGQIDLREAQLRDGRYQIVGDRGTLTLTLDPALQHAAEETLRRARATVGAIAIIDVHGRILALAGRHADRAQKNDPDLALSVWAPAASVFKLVTAAALLETNADSAQPVCYHGGVRSVRASNLVDDPRRDRRCDDLGFAVAHSQNAVIAKLAHRYLTPLALRGYATDFGFDAPLDTALQVQRGNAQIPDESLAFAQVAAGFWHTNLSAIGGALLANVVASGGMSVTPRIVDEVVDGAGQRTMITPAPPTRVVSEATARSLAAMMIATTESGTAARGFRDRRQGPLLRARVAGKTGTLTQNWPSYQQYSWFVGFAPADEPTVTIAVLLGNPMLWHLRAHTAARLVLQRAL